MYNQSGPADSRKVLSGKDAVLFNGEGVMLATVESFQVQVNVSNSDYQPLGDAQAHATMTGYKVSLTFSQMHSGQQPNWNFQGVVYGRNGSEQRMNYRGCVPDGNIDLQGASVGDIIKRAWNMVVNDPPELQKLLTA